MQTILQVEFSPSLALIREKILTSLGYKVIWLRTTPDSLGNL